MNRGFAEAGLVNWQCRGYPASGCGIRGGQTYRRCLSSSCRPLPGYVSLQHAWSGTGEVIDRTRYNSMTMSPYGSGFGNRLVDYLLLDHLDSCQLSRASCESGYSTCQFGWSLTVPPLPFSPLLMCMSTGRAALCVLQYMYTYHQAAGNGYLQVSSTSHGDLPKGKHGFGVYPKYMCGMKYPPCSTGW